MLSLCSSLLVSLAAKALASQNDGAFRPRAATAKSFATTSDLSYKLTAIEPPVLGPGTPGSMSTWSLTIDDTPSGYKQKITGFGAAVTDATVYVFNTLPSATRAKLLREIMTSEGVDFSLLRNTIASSDLSANPAYSYDDNAGQPDPNFASFNLGDRGTAMAKLLKDMKNLKNSMYLVSSPWSPPGWMKLNKVLMGTTVNNNLNHAYAAHFAQYFVKTIQAFQSFGVPVQAITIQNEPLNSKAGFPTMYVYEDESADLIAQNIGPALRAAGLSTTVWAYDHNTDNTGYPQKVLNKASQYVSGVAWHCYAGNLDWTVLSTFHDANPNAEQYMTECWTSAKHTGWDQVAHFTMGPLQNWAKGSIAWTMGTDTNDGPHLTGSGDACSECTGLVTINADGTYNKRVDYYIMGQFSKFIPQGATVLSGTGSWTFEGGGGIQSVASLNPDGTRTVVIWNTFGNDLYITLNTKSGQMWSGRVLSKSVVTWILPA